MVYTSLFELPKYSFFFFFCKTHFQGTSFRGETDDQAENDLYNRHSDGSVGIHEFFE